MLSFEFLQISMIEICRNSKLSIVIPMQLEINMIAISMQVAIVMIAFPTEVAIQIDCNLI